MNASRFYYSLLFVFVAFAGCASCDSETSGAQGTNDAGEESSRDVLAQEGSDAAANDLDGSILEPFDADPDGSRPDSGDYGCGIYQEDCDGLCTAVSVDPQNCGGCNITCSDNEVCSSGQCVDEADCSPGLDACQGSCVDFTWSNDHCGACGTACDAGLGCVNGECVESVELGESPEFCAGSGPPIIVDDSEACGGQLAESTFRWGACGCEGISMNGPLTVDAYDSSLGPYIPGGPGGGVGTNEDLSANEAIHVSGTLWTGGDFTANESSSIGQRLYCRGDVNISGDGDLSVGSHSYIRGDIQVETMTIDGNLYVTADSTLEGEISSHDQAVENVEVGRACSACDESERIDVGEIVDYRSVFNDNDLIDLSSDVLSTSSADRLRLELPCGNYYLDEIDRNGPTTIVATGNTALYVGEDIHANNELTITLTPDAQFDLFVAGDVDVGNDFRLGSPNYPALMRLYVGGDSGIGTNDSTQLAAFVYAVPGRFDTNQEVEVFGGLFAMEITTNDKLTIHYDRRIGSMGQNCPDDDDPDLDDPPDAGNPPDAGGDPDANDDPGNDLVCASGGDSCDVDGDCCTPLTCHENSCSLLTCQPVFGTCQSHSDCCTGVCATMSGEESGVCIAN